MAGQALERVAPDRFLVMGAAWIGDQGTHFLSESPGAPCRKPHGSASLRLGAMNADLSTLHLPIFKVVLVVPRLMQGPSAA